LYLLLFFFSNIPEVTSLMTCFVRLEDCFVCGLGGIFIWKPIVLPFASRERKRKKKKVEENEKRDTRREGKKSRGGRGERERGERERESEERGKER
jgi:hypothetical protein